MNHYSNNLSHSFVVKWNNSPNMIGTKPPFPQFEKIKQTKNGIGMIISKREPYAVEHKFTRYGELNTRLGTDMGTQ